MRLSALISFVVHFCVVVVVSLMMRPVPTRAVEEVIPVHLVSIEEQPPVVPASSVAVVKPGPAPQPRRSPSKAPAGGSSPNVTRKPKEAPAPPKVLTSKRGKEKVPEGKAGATGTEGTGTEPAGPTYGPGVEAGPLPVYPKNALDQNLEGTVTLTVGVSPEGKAASVRVAGSSGHKLLDDAAKRSVSGWTFAPGMKAGKPVSGEVTVKIRFANNSVERP